VRDARPALPVTNRDLRRTSVCAEVSRFLAMADLPGPFVALLHEALNTPGKRRGAPGGSVWPDIVVLCCGAASGGAGKMTVPAAAECFALELDLLNETEDDDASPLRDRHGTAMALTCVTALRGPVFQALGPPEQPRSADTCRGASGAAMLAQALVTATGGQRLGLPSGCSPALDQEGRQDSMAWTLGALVGGCCALWATLGGASAPPVALSTTCGRHEGSAAQRDNAWRDLWEVVVHGVQAGASDLRRDTQTAPVASPRAQCGASERRDQPAWERALWETGAVPDAGAVVQVHRAEALSLLERITQTAPVPGFPLALPRHVTDTMRDQDRPPPDPGSTP